MKKLSAFAAAVLLVLGGITTSLLAQNSIKTKSTVSDETRTQDESSLAPETSSSFVISQAYGGGGGASGTYIFDYVELKNVSSSPKSLGGLSLYYGSAAGQFGSSAGNIFALPNVTVQPGKYYLIQLSAAGTGGSAFPVTPDATTTNLSMSGTNGKVALVAGLPVNTCGATATPCTLPNFYIVDVVSWGAAGNAEGNAPTNAGASLTATQGNVRKTAGCTDTDNNNADFDVVTAPVPRNSATAAAVCGITTNSKTPLDMDGDGRTDYVVVRDSNGATAGGFADWYVSLNSTNAQSTQQWGQPETDEIAYADFDGDGKTDYAVWRREALSTFYVLQSSNNTIYTDQLGLIGDDPTPGDFNGDGKADVAVYRNDATAATQSFWFYRPTPGAAMVMLTLNAEGNRAEGDYDGDGKVDPAIFSAGAGSAGHLRALLSNGGTLDFDYGQVDDIVAPGGDYDGDGKADLCVIRPNGTVWKWDFEPSGTAGITVVTDDWGLVATDFPTPGDYNGDGKMDYAVWRSGGALADFFVMTPTTRLITSRQWGVGTTDFPAASGRLSNAKL